MNLTPPTVHVQSARHRYHFRQAHVLSRLERHYPLRVSTNFWRMHWDLSREIKKCRHLALDGSDAHVCPTVLQTLITQPALFDPPAHLGVIKCTTGAPLTGFVHSSRH